MITIKKTEFQKLYNIACEGWKKTFNDKLKDFIFTDTIDFEEKFIEEIEKACTKDQESTFREIFKKFLKEDTFSKVTNYTSLCKELGEEELELSDFKFLAKEYRIKALAGAKIQQMEKYFNKGWKPNYKDQNEQKWYIWWVNDKNSWSVYSLGYHCCSCGAWAGVYQTQKIAKYISEVPDFKKIYIEFMEN